MSVRSAQSITVLFTTRAFATGSATDATGTPTGTLYVNGTADAASVTVTNITTGLYKAAVTLPTLAAGDVVELRINATVSGVTDNGIIWGDSKDIALDSSYRPGIDWSNVGAPTTTLALTGTTVGVATTVTNQLTVAQIATGVWQDATSGDFTVSSSIGKSLYTSGVVPGGSGGLFIAGTNAATTVTTSFTTTFTGNLTGTTGGVTAAGAATFFTVNSTKVYADAVAGSVVKEISIASGATPPTAAQIATAVWQDTTSGDFTVSSSIGKSLYTSGVVPGAAGGHFIAGTNAATSVNITGNITGNLVGTVSTLTTYTGNTPQTGDAYTIVNSVTHGNSALKTAIGLLPTLGEFFTVDSGEAYADAIDGSVVKEIAGNAGGGGGEVTLDLTQAIPTTNTANTLGDCLNGARAQAFGNWARVGMQLILYAPNGTTVVHTFNIDSVLAPTSRTSA